MSALQETRSRRTAGPLFAIGEWLMILPAAIFLAAAALREMQPAKFEPGHTSWIIFNWAAAHVSHFDAAVIFLALPGIVLLAGCIAMLREWRGNDTFREDASWAMAILRRNFAACVVGAATVLGGAILAAVIVHLIVG